jgi:hypothetical protein
MSLEQVSQKYEPPEVKYLTRASSVEFLNAHGFPITLPYFYYLCSPAQGRGPTPVGRFGNKDIYDPRALLAWANGKLNRSQETAA